MSAAGASPAISPDRTLSSLLRNRSQKKSPNSSNPSLAGDSPARSPRHGAIRGSFDKGKSLLKTQSTNGSDDLERRGSAESNTSTARRLSKLVPKRKKKKKKDGDDAVENDEEDRGRPGSASKGLGISAAGNMSEDSLGVPKSGGSSLMTEDESETDKPKRPDLTSRPSHQGLLTFSSPLIEAETIDTSQSNPSEPSATANLSRSNSTPPNPLIITPDDRTELQAPQRRASIPAADLELSSSAPATTTTFPEGSGSAGSAALLGGLFGGGRRRAASGANGELKIDTEARPSTPPEIKRTKRPIVTPPNLVETPSTLVTPPTPTIPRDRSPPKTGSSTSSLHGASASQSELPSERRGSDSIVHRRVRSAAPPSKLGTSIPRPLSPTQEESKTPGGSLIQPSSGSGFFSSVFSATQNAGTQLSSFFTSPNLGSGNRTRSATSSTDPSATSGGEEVIETHSITEDTQSEKREPAIATLGSGNLSLSHLGITETNSTQNSMTSKDNIAGDVVQSPTIIQHGHSFSGSTEEASAAEAVSAAYNEDRTPMVSDQISTTSRPVSIGSNIGSLPGDATPPRALNGTDTGLSLRRSGSVRSRISAGRQKKPRRTSTTGSAIATALTASHAALANPATGGTRPTGFAVASSKRNKDFHQFFRSVPEDDYLIEDYSAALQRDILLQGRLYVSERHLCFSSNILGWVTNLVISFDEVVAMEKKNTAVIFPNAIVIQTLHARNVFASFISRDPTYDLLISIWKISHPNLKTSANGHVLDETAPPVEKTENAESFNEEEEETDEDGSDEYYDEDAEDGDGARSFAEVASPPVSDAGGDGPRNVTQKVSTSTVIGPSITAGNGSLTRTMEVLDGTAAAMTVAADFPGPAIHAPTECSDQATHLDKELTDTTIPAPLGKVYSLMFGPLSGVTMRKFLLDDQKSSDLQMEDDKKGMGDDTKTFSYSFIKPLNAPIGPKQTKCNVSQTLDAFDLEKAVSVSCSTATPDVPNGNIFVTKTKYCLMWGPSNSTRLIMNCTVEWSGKSWLKGPIEKGANEGQIQYAKDIVAFLKAQVSTKSPSKTPRGKVKGKKKRSATASPSQEVIDPTQSTARGNKSSWGPLDPLMGILGPVGDIVGPLLTTTGVLGLLLFVVSILWLRSPSRGAAPSSHIPFGLGGINSPHRAAAYEELWAREESGLWEWLEDRIQLDNIAQPIPLANGHKPRSRSGSFGSAVAGKLKDQSEKMSDRQIDEAIKVTEQRLEELKAVVAKQRLKKDGEAAAS